MSQLVDKITNFIKNYASVGRSILGTRPGVKLLWLVGVPVFAVLVFFSQVRCAVVLGDEVVAVASSRDLAESAVEEYIARLEMTTGMPVKIGPEINYRPTWRLSAETSKEGIQQSLADIIDYNYEATGIYVNDKMVGAVKDDATGDQVLNKLMSSYVGGNDSKLSFKQKVELKPVEVDAPQLMGVEELYQYIKFGGQEVRTYRIKEGDTLWDIASAVDLPVDELLRANQELNPDTMQIGQEITISQTSPLIDVIATYKDTRQEEVLYRVQEKVDQSLYLGEHKIAQKGKNGQREVTYEVTLENGVEVNKKVLEQKMIKDPVPEILAKGEKKLLAFRGGNNRLAYPTAGAIVSPYGKRWGRMHEGVDISANHGSPVVSAEAGTVSKVGYEGGYGLRVEVNHGGGVVTKYAHLSSAAVKQGQKVERGQFIARAGSSGNSTGPHLHFEVKVNGVHKNPALFI